MTNKTLDEALTEIILELMFDNPRKTYGDSFDLLVKRNTNNPKIVQTRKEIKALITEARTEQIMQDELSLIDTELPEHETIQWRLDRLAELKEDK